MSVIAGRPAVPTPYVGDDHAGLEVLDLHKSYGSRPVLRGVSFTVRPGELYGLLGPNGAGKTTCLLVICGLLAPDRGTVRLTGASDGACRLGYVPQDLALYPDLTARENLRFFGRMAGLPGRRLRRRIDELLDFVQLGSRADDRVASFSGGMKRRLNLAIGVLAAPEVVVLDEPTVGMDPQSRSAVLENLEELARAGAAVLYTSHYIEEVERLCDRIGILDAGVLIAEGTTDELLQLGTGRQQVRLVIDGDGAAFAAGCRGISGVVGVDHDGREIALVTEVSGSVVAEVLALADGIGLRADRLTVTPPSLETVFLDLTGRALRD